ncbi:MAG: aldo/keto reductase, partial [Steroidobacteraceae bacterium]
MDSHQTRRLLRAEAGLSSRLGLGTHALHWLFSGGARQGLLRLAYDLGIRHFDTAPSYGAGLAEREIGRFCLQHRSNLVVATKFGLAPGRLAASLPGGAY